MLPFVVRWPGRCSVSSITDCGDGLTRKLERFLPGLFDVDSLRRYLRTSRPEFTLSLITTLGVVTLGLLPGILIALALAMLKLLSLASFPHDAVLGLVETDTGLYATEASERRRIPGLVIYRFDASLLFFNADCFKVKSTRGRRGRRRP